MTGPGSEPKLKVLVFGASLRADSLNGTLAALAARVAQQTGAAVDHASMRDFDAKHYPCIKRAWVESLGEPPGSAADRVDPVPA
jgi:hypothetical protein